MGRWKGQKKKVIKNLHFMPCINAFNALMHPDLRKAATDI